MQASIPLVKPDDKPVGTMERSRWQGMHDLLLEHEFLKGPLELDNAFTTRFLKP
jgi:hypothetical protein